MIQITPHMQILVACLPIDFRKGIDGLAAVARNHLNKDPFSGTIFVFFNKRRSSMKILVYDGQGFWLCQKRLSKGKFFYQPDPGSSKSIELLAHQMHLLLYNGDPYAKASPSWKKI